MRIVFSHVVTTEGKTIGEEFVDTDQPEVLAMFSAWSHADGPPDSSGWNEKSNHPNYPDHTKYAVLMAEVTRLDDKPAIHALAAKKRHR